ncbi:cubilin-like isoform X3 [Haliotis rubra]|uniref:cubilin-like isoform X3 n=1 Tax=Haliotis rubra TaxID=36100 RepID=UPI001EE61FBE|nr:cubilin-like isoform X3 [Haliotis rubra]
MNVSGMICFTLVVSLLLAQTEGRAFNNAQSREKRQTSSCDGGTRYDTFGPISTNTEGQYSNNENCCWDFAPDIGGTTFNITFNFDTFELESSSTCRYDALTFYTVDGPEKECGLKTNFTRTFTVTESPFQVCFTSDSSVTGQGVSGSYSIAAGSRGSTTPSYFTTDYPDYYYNYYQDYLTTPYPYYVSTDYPNYVSTDYPYYYPTDYPQYPTTSYPYYYNYNQYPDYVTTPYPYYGPIDYPYNYQYPDYVSTPYPYFFPIDYPQYPTTSYPYYYNYNQYPDYVTTPYPYFFPIDYPYNYQYPDYLSTPYPYYPATIGVVPIPEDVPGCDTISVNTDGNTTYYGNHGSISINDDGSYGNSEDACFSLHPSFSGSGIITFVFNVFDIEEATDCIFDYIEFDDGNTRLRECGSVDMGTQREFEFHDGRFNVCFHSDGSVTGRGFQATYTMNPVQEVDSDVTTSFPVYIFNSTISPNFTLPVDPIFNSTMSPNSTQATTLPVNTTVNATDDADGDCNLDIDDLEGTYTLPTDSEGQYENNQHCDITIRSPLTPHITTVNFTRFDLEDDTGCDYDSLTITSDEGTENLCGTEESFTRQYTGQSVDMTFTSDGSVVRSGFSFDYVTEIVYCNATINAPSGTFESLPGGYENNMYCTYTINTPGPGELVFSFPLFDVESSSSCRYDAVDMEGDKLCGTNVDDKTYSTDGHFQIVFTSDGSVTRDGFRINFNFTQTDVPTSPLPTLPATTIPPTTEPETCNQVLTSDNGALTSPGNGSYANNENCVTVITGPNTPYTLVVSFTTFDLESSSNCGYDYLEVDTGLSSSLKGCGSTWRNRTVEYTSNGGNATVTFSSDSSQTGLGYSATYTIQPSGVPSLNNGECAYINTNISEGAIQSLPGTGSNYPNNMDCSYVFTRNTPFYLNINFTALDTESSSNCRYDYVQVGDDKYCGSDLPNATRVSVQGGSAIIRFRSDITVTGRGFVALFSIEENCNVDSDDLEGTYTLPTDSEGQYENNQHCDITIRSPPTPHITTVNFTRFDIEDDAGCDYDSVSVTSGGTTEKLCGAKESFIRQYNGPTVDMTFTSDASVVGSGFSFNYVTELVYCNATINGTSGTFESQPGGYDRNMYCTYTINTPGPGELDFIFPLFDVERGTSCPYDAVEMGGDRLCGTNVEDKTYSTDGHFQIVFTSDGSVTRDGFRINFNFTQTDVPTSPLPTLPVTTEQTIPPITTSPTEPETCNQVLTSDNGTLTSPGNGSYANNENCVTVITGPNTPYTLVVNFTTFDLESSSNCRYDYLEVDTGLSSSQKGCGSSWRNRTVEYKSNGGNATVTFSSDSSQTGLGYNATYTIQPSGLPSLINGECAYINTNISEGAIQSLPGTGSNYPNNMDCSYVFTRNTPFYLNINFTALDTESSSNCRYDYVQVGEDKYCGSDLPNATRVSVQGGSAIIRFRSDSSVTGRGFVALFSIEEHCNFDSDDLEGTYTLPTDSDGQYENNQHCNITIRSPSTPHITTVNFTRFDIEDDAGCDYDKLNITSNEGSENLCGAKEPFTRQYTDPTINMTFTSDGSVVRSGFSFNYVTELVYCNATLNATSGTFESQPGGYENNMNCTYNITTPGPGELVFSFPLFDVERGTRCRYDAVEMGGDKLCGTNVEDKTYSTDGHFQFTFTSDGSVNGDGFKIDFVFLPEEIQN